jgi:hypothetical protein
MIEVQNRGGVERSEGRRGFVLKAPAGTGGGEKEKENWGRGGAPQTSEFYRKCSSRRCLLPVKI